ncbi:hypothetical protein ACFQH6_03440 [Halobacteriaceae archaeon GCM10025711]
MNSDVSTERTVGTTGGPRQQAAHWLLLTGHRMVVAVGLTAIVFLGFLALVQLGVVAVGPSSSAATVFGSGLISGTLTLVTVALSINQLILSRVFGSPHELRSKLDGTRDLRRQIQAYAGEPTTPNDPAEFLSVVARTLGDHAAQFQSAVADAAWNAPSEVHTYADDVAAYADNIDDHIESQSNIVDVLDVVLGSEYAQNLTATEYVANAYEDDLTEAAHRELDAVDGLLEAIAITRQFFKTLTLQQDFARLSRVVAYAGFVALLASVSLALVYRSNSVTVGLQVLPFVVSFGIAVIVTPLTVFIAYILRAATIARRTVSVGPFVPPEERSEES